jgi:hypothetical protein
MSDKPRIQTVFIPLPEYPDSAMRISMLDHDVREAALQAKAKLDARAEAMSVFGWKPDPDAEYAIADWGQGRTLVARLRLTR